MMVESNGVFFGVGSLRDNAFRVKIIRMEENGLKLFRLLVLCFQTVIIEVQSVDFPLRCVLGFSEKNAKTTHHILYSFCLINFLMVSYSSLFWSPSEVVAVANKLSVLKIKFMEHFADDFNFIMSWSLFFEIEKLIVPIKSGIVHFPTDSVPNVANLLQQVNLLIFNVVLVFMNFLKDFFHDALLAFNEFPDFLFGFEFEDAVTNFGQVKVGVALGIFSKDQAEVDFRDELFLNLKSMLLVGLKSGCVLGCEGFHVGFFEGVPC
jgi:hypothetical protein